MASGTIWLMLAENLCAATDSPAAQTSIVKSLAENLLTPIPLCFALGIFCKLIHGGIKIPKELYYTISIFLLMSIGFMGGHELALAGSRRRLQAGPGDAVAGLRDARSSPTSCCDSSAGCRWPTRPALPRTTDRRRPSRLPWHRATSKGWAIR